MQRQKAELENVQHALETSKQETTNFAVFLQSRNELLDKIQEQVRQGYRMEKQELNPSSKKDQCIYQPISNHQQEQQHDTTDNRRKK